MGSAGGELSTFKTTITSLAERVHAVDVRTYESMPPEQLAAELQPIVRELLAAATKVVGDILSTCERATPVEFCVDDETSWTAPYVPFERAIDAAIDSQKSSSLCAVCDIAFLAHLELRQRVERLERVSASKSALAIVGECDSALRRILKALTSIDVALARAGLVEPTLDFASELEVSLRVRAACAKLRARVLGQGEPTRETLHVRLRGAGTAIAMLVGWEVYPLLRVRDRLQLRDVQRRILEWLRQEHDATAGLRLWGDLVGFLRLLGEVNRRQELVEHDRALVTRLLGLLAASAADVVTEDFVGTAKALAGLDDEVDLLLRTSGARAEAWRAALQRLERPLRSEEADR